MSNGVAFDLHVVGEESNETFTGKFYAKERLSWSDQLNSDRFRRELLGPNGAEAGVVVQNRATILAELNVRITDSPTWWKTARGGLDLVDDNVVISVYDNTQKIQDAWLKAQLEKGEAAKKLLAEKQKKDE